MSHPSHIDIIKDFQAKDKHLQTLFPVSFRVSAEEKALLKKMAGCLAISAFVRQTLFGNNVEKRPKRYLKKQKTPQIDAQEVARLLGMFGQSEIARSMLALSLAAQSGSLPVTPELTGELHAACDDIHDMRTALIMALNIKAEDGR